MNCICPSCGYDLQRAEPVESGPFHYDPMAGLSYNGALLLLSPSQALIAGALLRANGRTLSHSALKGVVGAEDAEGNLIPSQVCLLRARLARERVPCPIETLPGQGYRWRLPN